MKAKLEYLESWHSNLKALMSIMFWPTLEELLLQSVEKRYSQIEKEALSIVWA